MSDPAPETFQVTVWVRGFKTRAEADAFAKASGQVIRPVLPRYRLPEKSPAVYVQTHSEVAHTEAAPPSTAELVTP